MLRATSRYEGLIATSDQRTRTRLRSAGGPNAEKSLVAPAGLQPAFYNDEEFIEVLRWRLGLANTGMAPIWRNLAAKSMTKCGVQLDEYGDHAATCSYGPLRIKRHNAVADNLSDMITETSAHARREAYVWAFSTPAIEAWLHIWASQDCAFRTC